MKIEIISLSPMPIDVRTLGDPSAEPAFIQMEVEFILNNHFTCSCRMEMTNDFERAKKLIIDKIIED